jgi:pyrroloquinoline quinone biosynthesis protein D
MVKLNASAGEILSRVDGIKSVAVIISEIEEKFGLSNLSDDVVSFIGLAVEQGWVDLEGKKKDDS